MNRLTIALVVLFVASACGDVPTAVNEPGAPDPSFKATVETFVHDVRMPFSNSQLWPCTNEVVDFEGWVNVTARQVTSSSGNVTLRLHVIVQVKGVGQATGARYVSNEQTNLTQQSTGSGIVSTLQFRILRISKGRAPNSVGWIKLHLTYNAAGELTAFKNEAVFGVCRG